MFKVRRAIIVLGLILGIVSFCVSVQAKFEPVLTQNSVDGWLLGAEWKFTLFKFQLAKQELSLEPLLAAAYGLKSQAIRHKAGLSIGNFSLAHNDWPGSAVLGRVGEMGTHVGLKLKQVQISGFIGELWPIVRCGLLFLGVACLDILIEERGPWVAYLNVKSSHTFSLPFDIVLKVSSDMTMGTTLGEKSGPFRSTIKTISLRVGGLNVRAKSGTTSNEANLMDFELTARVKGYTEPLKGEKFWTLSVERRFELISPIELPVKLPMPMMAKTQEPLVFKIEGSVFFESGSAVAKDEEMGEILFGWGFGTIFSVAGFEMRAELFFNKEGEFKPLFEMGANF